MSVGIGVYTRVSVTEIAVEGSGEFPLDMLRYDSCWPATERDALRAEREHGRRVIWLRKTTPNGNHLTPTVARWQSFGWRVLDPLETVQRKESE